MSLGIRKWIVIALLLLVFLLANFMLVANWLVNTGVCQWAVFIRKEFLTGTAITVIITLLILLVGPGKSRLGFGKSCPVCDKRLFGNPNFCGDCGSKIA
jgi:hypothetical protein